MTESEDIEIGEAQRCNVDAIEQYLYENRHDYKEAQFSEQHSEQLFKWICDHSDLERQEAWSVTINGRKGFLTSEYDRNLGHEGIRFFTRGEVR